MLHLQKLKTEAALRSCPKGTTISNIIIRRRQPYILPNKLKAHTVHLKLKCPISGEKSNQVGPQVQQSRPKWFLCGGVGWGRDDQVYPGKKLRLGGVLWLGK